MAALLPTLLLKCCQDFCFYWTTCRQTFLSCLTTDQTEFTSTCSPALDVSKAENEYIYVPRPRLHTLHRAEKLYFDRESPVCGERHGDDSGFSWQASELMMAVRQAVYAAQWDLKKNSLRTRGSR